MSWLLNHHVSQSHLPFAKKKGRAADFVRRSFLLMDRMTAGWRCSSKHTFIFTLTLQSVNVPTFMLYCLVFSFNWEHQHIPVFKSTHNDLSYLWRASLITVSLLLKKEREARRRKGEEKKEKRRWTLSLWNDLSFSVTISFLVITRYCVRANISEIQQTYLT